jgi:branched-chain amino acid transport system substrate-binding protein
LATAFADALAKRGSQLAAQDASLEGSTDFTPQISNIQQAEPDILFIIGYYREGALIVQQAKRLGLDVPVLGSDGFTTEELIKLGGSAVEGVTFPGFFFPSDERFPGSVEFVAAYEAKYGEKPESYGALAYDTSNMIFEAMREKGVDRAAIRDYL